MHKLQEIIAVIAGATCSTGRNIRNFIVHFRTRCGQSRIVLSVSVLPLSLLMHAHTLTPAKRFSFADLQHLRSVGDVQISPDGHAIVYSLYSIDIQHGAKIPGACDLHDRPLGARHEANPRKRQLFLTQS